MVAGDPSRGQSFATGDAVNTAARLEQAATPGGVLLGEPTYGLVRDAVTVEPVEPLRAKGKSEPLPAYRLLAVKEGAPAWPAARTCRWSGGSSELAELERGVGGGRERGATAGAGALVGEAGVGKSRLAAELLAEAGPARSARPLPSYGEGITFWPVAEIVRRGGRDRRRRLPGRGAGTDRGALRGRGRRDAGRGGGGCDRARRGGARDRARSSPRSARCFEALAQERPLVLVLDDLHWAEETLLDLVEYLPGQAARPRSCCSPCPPRAHRAAAGLGPRDSPASGLAPLGGAESERLTAELLGAPLEPALLARLAEAAQGNPLYLEELLRTLTEQGALRRRDGAWAASGELAELETPPTIEALIAARLERLGPDERGVC